MSREDPQLKIRLPQELKDKISESASNLGRSINADVVARLEQSFETPKNENTDEVYELISEKFLLNLMRVLKEQGLDSNSINRTIVKSANLLLEDEPQKNPEK
ncbi:Arc family DNA-binding protein [Acinetobacter ursingii]|uniref:Arc family DNA-binding protein n=1 Tax=Acinetobacter ursingii TaxID=108980 RepID=UPI00244BD22E|nr:Arc family DNA-binding protein [Acinetobacter ursingii]MDH2019430.1 Arc family DNA-binding protein [Acinetobacter ursingii]MDH2071832.1 Arc family DNA-binding protein [Acinetobacter ursingii]